jgi:hypothetical protein
MRSIMSLGRGCFFVSIYYIWHEVGFCIIGLESFAKKFHKKAAGDNIYLKGTYTTSGGILTLVPTHIHGDTWSSFYDFVKLKWYSKDEFTALGIPGITADQIDTIFMERQLLLK